MKIAVIGAGISGLGCAHALTRDLGAFACVTLFEGAPRLGGHANTVDATLDGITCPVDAGFLVFSERTDPHPSQRFSALHMLTRCWIAASYMSFAVSVPRRGRLDAPLPDLGLPLPDATAP